MSNRFGFLLLLSFSCILLCEGAIPPQSHWTNVTFLPGSTEKIVWSFSDNIKSFTTRTWTFTPSDGRQQVGLAIIVGHGDVQILTTSYEVAVEKPATLVLKNVDLTYNGTYQFSLSSGSSSSKVVVYIAVKPNATACPSPIEVDEGGDLSCTCQGQGGNPPADVTWYKDNRKIGETGKEEKTLTLTNVTNEKDHKTYKCVAQSYPNEIFQDEVKVEVRVRPKFKPNKTKIEVPECYVGEKLVINCSSEGLPVPSFTITHNVTTIIVSNHSRYTKEHVDYSDAGMYKCTAKNVLGNDTDSANLIVKKKRPWTKSATNVTTTQSTPSQTTVKPNVTACSGPIIVSEGDNVSCTCQGQGGNPPADVTWYKDNRKIGGTGKEEKTLTLTNVIHEKDHGNYKCVAQNYPNEMFQDEVIVEVIVNYPPENVVLTLTKNGCSVTVECSAEAQPPASFKIFRNKNELVKNEKTYTIPEICCSHVGNYTCVADNILGRVSSNSEYLSIQDKASSNDTSCGTEWYVVVVTLVAGIIIGILFSYIASCSRRKFGSRKPQSSPEPQSCEVDSTYQELDLTKMNREDNYQSLRVDVAINDVTNDDDSNYTVLSKTRDVENNYQSLT